MKVHHKILPQYIEKSDLNNGTEITRGIELDITTTTKYEEGLIGPAIHCFWMTLPEAARLWSSLGDILIGKTF